MRSTWRVYVVLTTVLLFLFIPTINVILPGVRRERQCSLAAFLGALKKLPKKNYFMLTRQAVGLPYNLGRILYKRSRVSWTTCKIQYIEG